MNQLNLQRFKTLGLWNQDSTFLPRKPQQRNVTNLQKTASHASQSRATQPHAANGQKSAEQCDGSDSSVRGGGVSNRARVLLLVLGVISGSGAALCFASDQWLSDSLRVVDLPGDFNKAVQLSEVFAHGLGVLAIFATLFVVCVGRRPTLWAALLITVCCGVAGNLSKAIVPRVRPHSVEVLKTAAIKLSASEGVNAELVAGESSEIDSNALNALEAEVLRKRVQADFWDTQHRSFPSGHAATAAGFAIALSLTFPRGTVVFLILALFAGFQRVVSGAHYPSDVLAGFSLACCVASCLLLSSRLRSRFSQ